jgi:hypothetical protein
VVEPPAVEINQSEDGYYPLEVLVSGVAWPPNVEPTRREQYLKPEDFYTTFQMTKVRPPSLLLETFPSPCLTNWFDT